MGLFSSSSRSSNTTNDNDTQQSGQSDSGAVINQQGDGKIVVTDSGAIVGNVAIANQALLTAERIQQQNNDALLAFNETNSSTAQAALDQADSSIDTVKKVSENFGNSLALLSGHFGSTLETIKKAELTGGGSVYADLLKFWPIVPVAFVIAAAISSSKGGN